MKRNTIKIIISVILVHLLSACTPTDFLGGGKANLNFEVTDSTNQQQAQSGMVTVSLESQFITVKEGEETQIGVKLNQVSSSDIFVRLNLPGGEAKIGEDFLFESSTIHIPKGSLTASFKLQAIADAKAEQSETFFGELEVFQNDLAVVSGANLSVIIQDSTTTPPPPPGNPVVSLLSASGTASEAQAVYQIPVVLDKMAAQNVVVNIGVDANSSAILGQDFVIQGGNSLTIPAGSQNAFISISIIDDTAIEATPETISLSLTSAVNATIGTARQFQLTIIDNDAATPPPGLPVASFSLAAASVSEAAVNYNLTVSLDKPATQAVNIQYSIQSQSATLGTDFSIAQGTSVSIPAGQQSGTISIAIINDTQAEPTEIFNIILDSAVGASLGTNRSFALSIIDNDAPQNVDPLVSLASASGAASEGQGNYSINFNLSKAVAQNVTVMLTLSGSALQNQDFSLPMGDNIIIPAGATSASLPLVIIDDAVNEQTEVAVFTISSVVGAGAKLGAITSFSFSIMDNDAAPAPNANLQAYTQTLYNNIQRNPNTGRCFNCHRANGTQLQISPFHSQDDPALALQVIESRNLVNLSNPAASTLVTKVEGGHYPWSGSSVADAALIASYIQMWADQVNANGNGNGNPANTNKISTNALMVSEGQEVQGTVRHTADQIAFWDFKKGAEDNIIYDKSNISPAINLEMTGDIEWLGGQGISCNQNANTGKAQASIGASRKIFDRVNASKQYTIEAWISSTDKDQDGPTRILSYSNGTQNRNFTMGQEKEYFEFRNRNAKTGNNGAAPTYAPNDTKFVGDRPQSHHVVMVYDGMKRSLYVNGSLITGVDAAADDNVQELNWNNDYSFLFCNETSNNRPFEGSIYMAAVHDKALNGAQVMQNYDSGFTKKLALQFDVAEHTNPGAKLNIQVEVQGSELIFSEPKFSGLTSPVNLTGMKFAVNDQEAVAGQSYTYIENPNTQNDVKLSEVASVIKSENTGTDKISVHFQELGTKSQLEAPVLLAYEGDSTVSSNPTPADPSSVRLFSELYQSMANVTGVPNSNANTSAIYNDIKSGLPTDRGLDTFTSSHQINIIKLSYEFCNEMVNDASLRNAFYGNIDTSQTINAASKALIADAVLKKAVGRSVATQASDAQVSQEVSGLVDEMLGFNRSTTDILKGACVLGLGSMNNLVK